jgi:hypothetical protein
MLWISRFISLRSLWSWSLKAEDSRAAGIAKIPIPNKAKIIAVKRPMGVIGEISPYPTEARVMTAQ